MNTIATILIDRPLLNMAIAGMAHWDEQKMHLKEKFPSLTDADLQYEMDEALHHVQEKLGKTDEEMAAITAAL